MSILPAPAKWFAAFALMASSSLADTACTAATNCTEVAAQLAADASGTWPHTLTQWLWFAFFAGGSGLGWTFGAMALWHVVDGVADRIESARCDAAQAEGKGRR